MTQVITALNFCGWISVSGDLKLLDGFYKSMFQHKVFIPTSDERFPKSIEEIDYHEAPIICY